MSFKLKHNVLGHTDWSVKLSWSSHLRIGNTVQIPCSKGRVLFLNCLIGSTLDVFCLMGWSSVSESRNMQVFQDIKVAAQAFPRHQMLQPKLFNAHFSLKTLEFG